MIAKLKQTSGMTNESFVVDVCGTYVVRTAGKGSSELVNRDAEKAAYDVIKHLHISDELVLLVPETGLKITEYIPNSRNCDATRIDDVIRCMNVLKQLHSANLHTDYVFDLRKTLNHYESLIKTSKYASYNEVRERIDILLTMIDNCDKDYCLCHIDAVPDNFLLTNTDVRLIDWEYAGMQDPDIDIAMFAIYANYSFEQINTLTRIYDDQMTTERRKKIYAYVAICGLIWSNWCEYKEQHGIDFGEYAYSQYKYAEDYSKYLLEGCQWNRFHKQ